MGKKKVAILKISVVAIITTLLLIFSFISFDGYAGFYNAVQKGIELDTGIYANYTVERAEGSSDEEFAEDFENTFLKIKSLIDQKNYQGATVFKAGNNTLRIETPVIEDSNALLTEIGAGLLKIMTSDDSSADVELSGDDVTFAVATTSSSTGYWGTYIQFTEEAGEIISDLTEDATSSSPVYLYFFRGDAEDNFFYLPVSSQITADYLFISSSTGSMTQDDAVNLAITISCGSMPAVVNVQGDVEEIFAINGAMLGLTIALGVLVLLILLIFGVIYRELGYMANITILFFIGASLFLMQAIPVITLTSASLGAMLIGIILISAFNLIILEKIKKEYSIGKKLSIAIKTGYKKSINLIIDISAGLTVVSLISYFICTGILQSFMMILLTVSLIACLSSLLGMFILTDAYSVFNKNDGKKVNFTREEGLNENN